MFTVIGCMIAGIFIGYAARRIRFSWISLLITGLIWILLFLLGWEVGHNKGVISALPTLGLDALLLTLAALLGSSLAAWGLWEVVCVTYKGKDTIQKDREVARRGGNIACEEKDLDYKAKDFTCKKENATGEKESAICKESETAHRGGDTARKEKDITNEKEGAACKKESTIRKGIGTAYKKGGAASEEKSADSEEESAVRKEEKEEKR